MSARQRRTSCSATLAAKSCTVNSARSVNSATAANTAGTGTGPDLESLDRRYDCVEQIGFAKHEKELAQAYERCNAIACSA